MRWTGLLLVVLMLTGCGSDAGGRPSEDPGEFVRVLVKTLYAGKTGRAWDSLHPLHQTTVPRARYVACEQLAPLEGDVRRIEIVGVHEEQWAVPGEQEEVESTAVTVRLTLALPGAGAPQPLTHTAHVFDVEGRWAWVIGPGDYARYAEGACPASTPT